MERVRRQAARSLRVLFCSLVDRSRSRRMFAEMTSRGSTPWRLPRLFVKR